MSTFNGLVLGTTTFISAGTNTYLDSSLALGAAKYSFKIAPGTLRTEKNLPYKKRQSTITFTREHDVTVNGIVYREPITVSMQIMAGEHNTEAQINTLIDTLADFCNSTRLTQVLNGAG